MASRLSEQSLVQTYDQGHKSFYVRGLSSEGGSGESPLEAVRKNILGTGLDLDKLVDTENPQEAVEAVAPQELYHALMLRGPEDTINILPYLSQEQWVKILDYDVWQQDELSPEKMARWIELYAEVGKEELARRYQSLDEEYQTAFLAPLIELVELEDYEKLSDLEQDRFHALPCGELFYAFKTDHPKTVAAIELLISSLLAHDINYLYSLLSHSFHLPPGEQETVLNQMRRARLGEDGFLTFEESYEYFVPLGVNEQRQYLPRLITPVEAIETSSHTGVARTDGEKKFLEKVAEVLTPPEQEQLRHQLLVLANALCSATRVEPDDLRGAEMILGHGQAALSLALEWVSGGDPRGAAQFLLSTGPKVVFRTGLSLVHQYAVMVLESMVALGLEGSQRVLRYYTERKFGLAINLVETLWLEVLGLERTEWLKGLLNRFPLRLVPQKTEGLSTQEKTGKPRRQGATVENRPSAEESEQTQRDLLQTQYLVFEPVDSLRALSGLALDVEAFIENLHHAIKTDATLGSGNPVGTRRLDLDRGSEHL